MPVVWIPKPFLYHLSLCFMVFVMMACNQALDEPNSELLSRNVGALEIFVTGLPSTIDADIIITGPQRYRVLLTRSELLNGLRLGDYEIEAGGTAIEGEFEVTFPKQSVTLIKGSHVLIEIAYAPISAQEPEEGPFKEETSQEDEPFQEPQEDTAPLLEPVEDTILLEGELDDASGCRTGLVGDVLTLAVAEACLSTVMVNNLSTVNNAKYLIVVIHGLQRNADSAFRSISRAVPLELSGRVAILAPKFFNDQDAPPPSPLQEAPFHVWRSNRWTEGNDSIGNSSGLSNQGISSFAIIDSIVAWALEEVPSTNSVTNIVIAGHSAGGQFVNRYAAGTAVAEELERHEKKIRFIVANPSSYLYFDDRRPVNGNVADFAHVDEQQRKVCPSFNRYKYGLEQLNSYMKQTRPEVLLHRYLQQDVVHLIGSEDNDPNGSDLAVDCAAMLQGEHRLGRGLAYHYYINFLAQTNSVTPISAIVEGVDHNSGDLYSSPCGRTFLFEDRNAFCATLSPNPNTLTSTSTTIQSSLP